MTKQDLAMRSGLELAFIGDAVYELFIREKLVEQAPSTVGVLQKGASSFACASTQAAIVKELLPHLTEEEESAFKRGRNAKSKSIPKNASQADYAAATGLESLIGYLHLTNNQQRLQYILEEVYKYGL